MTPSQLSPQYVMQANADTVKLWQEMAEVMAQAGGQDAEQARRFLVFFETPEHRNTLWTFASILNLAFGATAFQVPLDETASRDTFQSLVQQHPELAWIFGHERAMFDFQDINPDLDGQALEQAQLRLKHWLGS
jgi:hypothetical protein